MSSVSDQHDGHAETDEPLPIGAALDRVVASLRGPGRAVVGGVFGRWEEAVGEQVAMHVKPIKLDRQVLHVEVDDPTWATQVSLLSSTIIDRLREVAGAEIERIAVRVDPRSARGAR